MYKVVASFFDGFSGTMFALDKLGIEPDEYHAFEIDPYPTAVSKYNFPNIIRHGDARNWTKLKGKKIDPREQQIRSDVNRTLGALSPEQKEAEVRRRLGQ